MHQPPRFHTHTHTHIPCLVIQKNFHTTHIRVVYIQFIIVVLPSIHEKLFRFSLQTKKKFQYKQLVTIKNDSVDFVILICSYRARRCGKS